MIIMIMLSLAIWGFGLLMELFGVGLVVSPILESFFTFATWLFFRGKNDPYANNLGANIAQYAANIVPFIPSVLISFLIKAYIYNHPQVVSSLTGIAEKSIKI